MLTKHFGYLLFSKGFSVLNGDRAERYIQSRGEQSQPCASLGPTHVLASAGTSVVADGPEVVFGEGKSGVQSVLALPSAPVTPL